MRLVLLLPLLLLVASACGSVSDTPLGGPYGGTTESTPPIADAGAPLDLDASPD